MPGTGANFLDDASVDLRCRFGNADAAHPSTFLAPFLPGTRIRWENRPTTMGITFVSFKCQQPPGGLGETADWIDVIASANTPY